MNDYSLQPFSINSSLPDVELTASIVRHSNTLVICYTLIGNLAELMIPAPADLPARKDELWEQTCFEFFLALKQSPQYWEFNLSPAGHWNIYRFAAYRQGMQAEMAFRLLPFRVQTQPSCLSLALELDLTKIVPVDQALEVAISTVIKPRDGEVSYWALTHPGSQADFHHRDSFLVEL